MVVLGIDPGLACTGFGIVAGEGSRLRALASGTIATTAGADTAARLASIQSEVGRLLDEHEPTSVALESLFIGTNPRTILSVGQARGAVLAACGAVGLDSCEYSPSQVKSAVCGYGRAEKGQVARMVGAILSLQQPPETDHASDALAVAVCHLWHAGSARAAGAAP
jgi:crossover junction endodeoxyribonuclease RuvC